MEMLAAIADLFPMIALIVALSVGGWVAVTWLKIRNGYPLEGTMGQALHPQTDRAQGERVTLLTQENAQLRAEIGSVKDRLATVERIVTDGSFRLDREIEQLRSPAN